MQASRIRTSSYGGHNSHVTIEHLTREELDVMHTFPAGRFWVHVNKDGRLECRSTLESIPPSRRDSVIAPHWDPKPCDSLFRTVIGNAELTHGRSPSIIIQHLCGYNFSDPGYKAAADSLEMFGFECLRSRRGLSGKYWELWLLPYLRAAKDRLRDAIDFRTETESQVKAAVSFLCCHVSFGTLDVCVQRAAMVVD